jgi:replication-associated recombination protein RarA
MAEWWKRGQLCPSSSDTTEGAEVEKVNRCKSRNVASAFIKSMRGSDLDAAIAWLARMLEAVAPRTLLRLGN